MASFTESLFNYNLKIGTSTNIGGGITNQDRVSNFSFVSKGKKCEMVIILDGHGSYGNNGEKWAKLILAHANHYFIEYCDIFIDNPIKFLEEWCEKTNSDISLQVSSGGSTLTIAIFMTETIFFCILGDSDAIWFSNKNNLSLDSVIVTDTLTGISGPLLPSSLDETHNSLSLAGNHTPGNKIEYSVRRYIKVYKTI
jgi:serine/threonine protein phosphatase PrpC